MKAKMNLGEGGIQGAFVRHVEKLVLGVAVLLVVWFLYSGVTLERFDQSKTPKDLQTKAQSARTVVERTTWDELKDEPERDPKDIKQRLGTRESSLPTLSDGLYRTEMAWLPPTFPLRSKRSDPQLFAPIKLEAIGQYGPVAIRRGPNDKGDPILDIAIDPKKDEKPKPATRTTRRTAGLGESSYPGMEGMEYGGMPGYGGAASVRRPSKEQLELIPGFQASGAAAAMAGGGSEDPYGGGSGYGGGAAPGGAISKGYYFVALKALFPIKRQWEEYERCFAETGFYNAARDVPKVAYYRVERAIVADDKTPPGPDDWKPLSTPGYFNLADLWAGAPKDIVHPDYYDDLLTGPVPPVMNRSLDELMLHSEVPRRPLVDPRPVIDPKATEEPELEGHENDPLKLRELARTRGTGGRAGMYGPGMGDSGYEMTYESEGGYGNMGYGSGGMEGDYGMGGQSRLAQPPPVDYKLIRFFDFTARPGVKYTYRVQVWLEDPNHPQSPELSPRMANLDDDVVIRLREVEIKEKEREKAELAKVDKDGKPVDLATARARARIYYRMSDWSDPSNIATIPQQYQVVAGAIEPEPRILNRDPAPGYSFARPGAEPKAAVMAIRFEPALGADVPVEIDAAFRGSLVNVKKNTEVLHPIQLILKTIDYDLRTDNMVLDIRGGEILPPHPDSRDADMTLKAPGELLVIDHQGRLKITRELDDLETFRRYDWPDEEVKKPVASEMDMYGDGSMPGYGEEGARGRRGRRGMNPDGS